MSPRRAPTGRDHEPSAFAPILETLVRWSPSLVAAMLVAGDGETVDYAGNASPFAMKVTAAHSRLLLAELAERLERHRLGPSRLWVRCGSWGFAVLPLPEEYALALILRRRSFSVSERALVYAERELCREAAWPPAAGGLTDRSPWVPVSVEAARGRPKPLRIAVGNEWSSIEVLGSWRDRPRRELGFRVRVGTGVELTLVREPLGRWFADEPVQDLVAATAPPFVTLAGNR